MVAVSVIVVMRSETVRKAVKIMEISVKCQPSRDYIIAASVEVILCCLDDYLLFIK